MSRGRDDSMRVSAAIAAAVPLVLVVPLMFQGVYLYESEIRSSDDSAFYINIKTGILVSEWDYRISDEVYGKVERNNFEDAKMDGTFEAGWNCGDNDAKDGEKSLCPDLRVTRNIFYLLLAVCMVFFIGGIVVSTNNYGAKVGWRNRGHMVFMTVAFGAVMVLAWVMVAVLVSENGPYEKSTDLDPGDDGARGTGKWLEGLTLLTVAGAYSTIFFLFATTVLARHGGGKILGGDDM